jgi:ATP-binding cassette subfamily F protein 3
LQARVTELEARIAEREKQIKEVEAAIAAPDFYASHEQSKPVLDRHQALMWEVGELLGQWEMLQSEAETYSDVRN